MDLVGGSLAIHVGFLGACIRAYPSHGMGSALVTFSENSAYFRTNGGLASSRICLSRGPGAPPRPREIGLLIARLPHALEAGRLPPLPSPPLRVAAQAPLLMSAAR